ncbi:MAG TPA: methionyl-tRNA formyltransferase [Streptosporangiales bacterium]
MRLVFAGTPDVAVPALDALLASRHEVVAAVTRPDAPAGRGRRLEASPVARRAGEAGVEVLKPARIGDPDVIKRLERLAPDCCPVVAYGALLPPAVLAVPRHGWVHLHFSLLPAWRGAAPVPHAVRAGDDVTGASVFRIVEELDAGPVFGTVTEPVRDDDTAGDLLDRLAHSGAKLLVATLDGIEDGTVRAAPQPADGVSYAPKLTSADGEVRWDRPARAVDRQVRSVTPAPGAWTVFRGDRLKLGPVAPTDAPALPPGRLRVGRGEVLVGTATTPVRLGEVQPQGRRRMAAADWARGVRDLDAAVLGA